jgi:hypothetical protein
MRQFPDSVLIVLRGGVPDSDLSVLEVIFQTLTVTFLL